MAARIPVIIGLLLGLSLGLTILIDKICTSSEVAQQQYEHRLKVKDTAKLWRDDTKILNGIPGIR